MTGRILNDTEQQFFNYCEDERQAVAFAKLIELPKNCSHEYIENVVLMLLLKAKEAVGGSVDVEYVSGRRCDHWREQ